MARSKHFNNSNQGYRSPPKVGRSPPKSCLGGDLGGFLRGAGGDLGGGFRRILFTSEYGPSGEIHTN